jgi:Zn-dependent protease
MNKQSISLGRLFGIPVYLDYSWFLIFALLTWTLAVGYFPSQFKNWPTVEYWLIGAATAIMLFVSVLLHELGHSIVALFYKIPVRSITLFIFGGISQISSEPTTPLSEFLISIAGPLVSVLLGAIFFFLRPLTASTEPILALVQYLIYINIALAIFNLIPGYPLDGGGVLMSIIWGITNNMSQARIIAANIGRVIAYLFIILGVWQAFSGNFINGLWIAFIGFFLNSAASGQVQQQKIQDMLEGHKVSDAMSRNYTALPEDTTLQELVDEHILRGGRRSFIVEEGNQVKGLLTLHHIKEVPRDQWPNTTVAQAMLPVGRLKQINPDTELWMAMEAMDRDGVNQLPVMMNGQIQGMLTREDVISYLRTLREFRSGS